MAVTTKNAVSTPAKFEVGKRYRISPDKVRTITVLKRNPTTIDFCLNGNESKIIRRKFYTDSGYSHDAESVAYGSSKSPDYFWVVAKDVVDDAEIEQVADTVAETEITEGKPVNEYEIEEAAIVAIEEDSIAQFVARILANETLKIRYDKAKTQVKYERYENGYCGWYFKGKNRDNWECTVTKATACLTRYGLSRFEFIIFSDAEVAVIENAGYDETAFDLLPTVDELNDIDDTDEAKRVADKPTPEISEKESLEIDIKILVDEIDEAREALAQAEADSEVPQEHIDNLRDVIDRKLNEYYETYAKLDALNSTPEIKQAADTVTDEAEIEVEAENHIAEQFKAVRKFAEKLIGGQGLTEEQANAVIVHFYAENGNAESVKKLVEEFKAANFKEAQEVAARLEEIIAEEDARRAEIELAAATVADTINREFDKAVKDSIENYGATLDINGETLTFEGGQLSEIASTCYGAYFKIRNGRKIFYYRGNRVSKQDFFAHIAVEDKAADERAKVAQFVAKFGGSEIKPGTNPQANFVAQIHPILANGRQDSYHATFANKVDAHNFINEFKTLAGGMKFLATIKRGSFFGEELYRHGLKGQEFFAPETDAAKTYTLTIYTDVWTDGDNTLVENYDTCRHLHISGKYLISKHSWKLTRGGKTIATGDGVKDFCHFITCEFDVSERLAEIADVKSASLEICGENVHFRNGKCIIVHSPKYHASFYVEAGIDGNEHYEIIKSDERGKFTRFEFVTEEEFFNTLERRGGCTVDKPAIIDNNGYDETAFELLPTVDEGEIAEKFYRETESTFREMKSAVAPARKFLYERIFDIYHFDYFLRILNQRGELKACPNKFHLVDTRFDVEVDRCELDYVIYFGNAELARYRTVENVNRAVDQLAIAIANRRFEFTFPEDEPPEIAILSDELDKIGNDICDTKDILELKIAAGAPQSEIKPTAGNTEFEPRATFGKELTA